MLLKLVVAMLAVSLGNCQEFFVSDDASWDVYISELQRDVFDSSGQSFIDKAAIIQVKPYKILTSTLVFEDGQMEFIHKTCQDYVLGIYQQTPFKAFYENGIKIGSDHYAVDTNKAFSTLLKTDDNSKAIIVQGNCKYITVAETSKMQSASSLGDAAGDLLERLCPDCESTFPKSFTKDEIAELKSKFAAADTSKTGIDVTQLSDLITSVGGRSYFDPLSYELNDIFERFNSSTIDVSAFLSIMVEGKREDDKTKQIREAFRTYDQDGDGYINVDEFDNPPDNAPANLINSYSDHVFTCCSDSIYVDPDYDYGSLGLCYYKNFFYNMIGERKC